jgi:hypothetical protein
MLIASLIGAALGVYYTASVKPLNNAGIFITLGALVFVALANVALMVGVKIYDWMKVEETKPQQVTVEEANEAAATEKPEGTTEPSA